ncbi:flagellar hook-basal body complex protein FliE [Sporanaerobacter acetigenes]|uniref:Flagellar hook-basal body complex protein FliE n=1 Tax=Sporanaerobacter acetigenes DSM 13106 TaxID=1123281 RepID=A0A1M5XZB6_9FIRM|nr:flagellar hook-basal body complex protein FliE [Sporanaerobacter acetigenes]SHI05140.1 flagellar hook-basal body complex protein FliE [Sporanaerobacter acetigenes DSM 13106]
MNINPIQHNKDATFILNKDIKNEKNNEISFGDYLKNSIDEVNRLQVESQNYKNLLATGEVDNLHDVTIAAEKANIALQLTMSIRNKVVDAYREIMRMQI